MSKALILKLSYCLFLVVYSFNIYGQQIFKNNLQERKLTEQGIVLLKNDHNSVPIQHLENSKIALLSNLVSKNYMEEALEKYAKITRFNFDTALNSAVEKKQLSAYTIIIVALHTTADVRNLSALELPENKIIVAFSKKIATEFLSTSLDFYRKFEAAFTRIFSTSHLWRDCRKREASTCFRLVFF